MVKKLITSASLVLIAILLSLSLFAGLYVGANNICSDVVVVFARGSGQPPGDRDQDLEKKKELSTFFNEIKARAPADITVETKELEYPAAGGPLPGSFPIWLNAELPWNAPGTYYSSVGLGIANLNQLLNDQVRQCPNQKFILGGYSQGAHVMGNALYTMGDGVKNNIVYVGLFGDPKFRVDSYASRGSFKRMLGGILESRVSDFPSEFQDRLQSWCKSGDGICENNLAVELSHTSLHNTYPTSEIPIAANYAASLLKQYFAGYQLKSIHPGLLADKLDVVYVVDTTSTMQGVLNNLLSNTAAFTNQTIALGTETRLGLVQYNDSRDGCGIKKPEVLLDLTSNVAQFPIYFNFLSGSCGGSAGDDTYAGLWTGITSQAWREDARKLIILLAGNTPNSPDRFNAGLDEATVVKEARAAGISISSVIRGDTATQINAHLPLIEKTGGKIIFMKSGTTSAFLKMYDNLSLLLTDMLNLPVAKLSAEPAAALGWPINFNAGESYDPDGTIVRYHWDFDSNGTYEQATSMPYIEHLYTDKYDGLATVKVVAADGGEGIASAQVSVSATNNLPDPPPKPSSVGAHLNIDNSVTLSWSSSTVADGYKIYSNDGTLLGVVGAEVNSATITNLPIGLPISFTVGGFNEDGPGLSAESNEIAIMAPDNGPVATNPVESPGANTPLQEQSPALLSTAASVVASNVFTSDIDGLPINTDNMRESNANQTALVSSGPAALSNENVKPKWYVVFLPSLVGILTLSRFLIILLE